jgi:hypothetical protein
LNLGEDREVGPAQGVHEGGEGGAGVCAHGASLSQQSQS